MKKLLFLLTLMSHQAIGQPALRFERLDLNAGPNSSSPNNFCIVGNKLYFTATTPATGSELWVTDGTVAGTQVLEINPGADGSSPSSLHEMAGKLVFLASSPTSGMEPWISDGTVAGTQLIKDIMPGTGNSTSELDGAVLNGKMYFAADDITYGREIWVTDGTTAGTQMLIDIRPGFNSSHAAKFITYNNKVYFSAMTDLTGLELWATDGTTLGTQMVDSGGPVSPDVFTKALSKLFFRATKGVGTGDELWVTDGTTAGTQMLKQINPPGSGTTNEFVEFSNNVYFSASDGINGAELWMSDGTAEGTVMVKDINPGVLPSGPVEFEEYNGKLYFNADNGSQGRELWVTDGTASGTQLVTDIFSGSIGGHPRNLIVYKGYLYFEAIQNGTAGRQLFISDGSISGTKVVAPTATPPANTVNNPPPALCVYDSMLFFQARYDTTGFELWLLTNDTSTNIRNHELTASVRIYPNPSNGTFTIETGNKTFTTANLEVYDVAGRLILSQSLASTKENIRLPETAKGMYLVKIAVDDALYATQLIIE
ncbi:ELWxxDGT repeat protein [Polluticoccus soli]|uniref:ELWxxDGT repeat protein n=1 Tax=Polluticoccus soli TaxID=3034150 RepID=UPI0023E22918|nr:ELWxxDGT repeat protein [Flavipsychrobacter sp. JY13-12]